MSLRKLLFVRLPFSPPSFGQILALFSCLGVAGLAYLYGAAAMYFQLPSADFLDNAFGGAKAWQQRGRSTIPVLSPEELTAAQKGEGIAVDKPAKTWNGFTLYVSSEGARATLIDMRGTVVHRWELPFSKAWADPPHVDDPINDAQIHWFHCYLYPNGDLLAIYHADGDTPYGYGLVKLDKNSRLLWAYAARVHHAIDVGEDGTIYTLVQKLVSEPQAGLEFLPTPYLADSLVILSPEGRKQEIIPLADAFANSPYAQLLHLDHKFSDALSFSRPNGASPTASPALATSLLANEKNDLFHANSVKVLSRSLAPKFPRFQAGHVLVSVRNLDTLAVVDRATRRVIWAAQGAWQLQHDAELLDNGHLLLYDNLGSLKQTRILEYDPRTQAIPWAYSNEGSTPFRALHRGAKQRFPNGNTLIVDPDARRLFEVTRDKELVWEYFCPLLPVRLDRPTAQSHSINSARRYGENELTFLREVAHARP
jgi:hypothetical protein